MKVMCAMSGGVDSSVAALLLQQAGHDVVGVTMKLWGGDSDTGCCSVSDVDDARRVAQQLDIDHLVFNFGDDFETHVVGPYVAPTRHGITPNPCIECNRRSSSPVSPSGPTCSASTPSPPATTPASADRRRPLPPRARCRSGQGPELRGPHARPGGSSPARCSRSAASRSPRSVSWRRRWICAPRQARQPGRVLHHLDRGREAFLGERIPFRPGRRRRPSGEQLGAVESVEMVTVGQRKGLGLPGGGPKRYVVDVDTTAATVTVGTDDDLLRPDLAVDAVTWVDEPVSGDVLVQCSAHGRPQPAVVTGGPSSVTVTWERPQRRVAPGQSVVFYTADDTAVLGGGICR
jgi:tRNA-uridine 2-sulfurtransferase